MDLGLADKVAVVTASSKGLGKAVALGLAQEGAKVVICARGEETLHTTAQEIRQRTSSEVLAVRADVTVPEDITALIAQTVDRFGGIDILVTNAGGPPPGQFDDFSDANWESATNLTLMSAVRLCRAAIPHMRERGGGRIIAMTSVSVKQPIENLILSNSIRMGVVGLMKTLADELAPYNILVNCVCPGYTSTQRVVDLARARAEREERTVEEIFAERDRTIPLGRAGKPEEFANLVVFLASDRASYITGTAISVDGGYTRSTL